MVMHQVCIGKESLGNVTPHIHLLQWVHSCLNPLIVIGGQLCFGFVVSAHVQPTGLFLVRSANGQLLQMSVPRFREL